MPGTYCQYINCKRTRRKPGCQNLRLFRFPNNQDISKQWIINCGQTKFFELEPKQLHSKYICELHFTPESFMDPFYKQRLTPSAIPIHFSEDQTGTITLKSEVASPRSGSPVTLPTPIKTYKPAEKRNRPSPKPPSPGVVVDETDIDIKCIDLKLSPDPQSSRFTSPEPDEKTIEFTNTPFFPSDQQSTHQPTTTAKEKYTVRETQLKSRIEKQRRTIKVKQEQLRRMKAKVAKLEQLSRLETVFDNFEFPSQPSKTIAKMQCKTQHRQWTIEERNLALMMFYQSPTTYTFLRRLGIVMPSDWTIRHWIGQSKFQSSFSKRFLKGNGKKCDDDEISTNDEGAGRPNEMDVSEGCEEVEDFGHLDRSDANSDPSSVLIQEESG